jgi:hypothetical protein
MKMKNKVLFKKIIGGLSVIGLGVASISPQTLHIPVVMRPWVFIFSIAWILLMASGIFSP